MDDVELLLRIFDDEDPVQASASTGPKFPISHAPESQFLAVFSFGEHGAHFLWLQLFGAMLTVRDGKTLPRVVFG